MTLQDLFIKKGFDQETAEIVARYLKAVVGQKIRKIDYERSNAETRLGG